MCSSRGFETSKIKAVGAFGETIYNFKMFIIRCFCRNVGLQSRVCLYSCCQTCSVWNIVREKNG